MDAMTTRQILITMAIIIASFIPVTLMTVFA